MSSPKKKDTKFNTDPPQNHTTPARSLSSSSLPTYYDSEPSSQPPKYTNLPSRSPRTPSPPPGAPASHIAAILAYPSAPSEQQARSKRPLKDRWRDWRDRTLHPANNDKFYSYGTSPRWNVQGTSVRQWGSAEGYRTRPERRKT